MRDAIQPVRWADIGLVGPALISLYLAVWALVGPMSGQALAVLISIQSVLLATAAAMVAASAARQAQVWQARQTPSTSQRQVFARWRRAAVWMHALGLFGSVALAIRLMAERQVAAALWSVSLPVIGVALGSFGGWAWHGFAPKRWLAVWPCVPVTVVAVYVAWPWLAQQVMLAFVCAGFAAGASLTTWRQAGALRQTWQRSSSDAQARQMRRTIKLPARRWAVLAFDGHEQVKAQSHASLYSTIANVLILTLLFGRMGAPLFQPGATLDIAQAWGLAAFVAWTGIVLGNHLVFRALHWRLRLAPGTSSPARRVLILLGGSASLWLGLVGAAWAGLWVAGDESQRWAMRAAAGPLMLDLLLVLTLVIWARGGCNRGLRVVLPVLTLSFFVGVGGTLCSVLGKPWVRGPLWICLELLLLVLMLHSGLRRWQGKPMHALETPARRDARLAGEPAR
ncbi:hypothetical protein [Roseateles sp.]|uniref:hypothetical protein n=1 Tax=Roseateles sp. TaxID=1971397 RepID=UPI0039582DAD